MDMPLYLVEASRALEALASREDGLTASEAAARLAASGRNEFSEDPPPGLPVRFLGQLASPLVLILLAAAFLLLARGQRVDGGIVLAVLLANAAIGVVQEGKAARALASLKSFSEAGAVVLRSGERQPVPEAELVPGDVVLLQEGDKVPADLRLIRVKGLAVDESVLTGESDPVHKRAEALAGVKVSKRAGGLKVPLYARTNMAFKGTYVTAGSATGAVTATGPATEMGAIYAAIRRGERQAATPLHRDMRRLSLQILAAVAALSLLIIAYGSLGPYGTLPAFELAVSLAVSVVPEGLPIVMTYVLATGVARMAGRNVLVRRLEAVEALGRAKVVAVDKTGTITLNQLAVVAAWHEGAAYKVEANGYEPRGRVRGGDPEAIASLAEAAALCSNARIGYGGTGTDIQGDPTEAALTVFAGKLGVTKERLEREAEPIEDTGFIYASKVHAVLHKDRHGYLISVVGAPEAVLGLCGHDEHPGVRAAQAEMAGQGLRVVAAASARYERRPDLRRLRSLAFAGLLGMRDSLHPEARAAVRGLRRAGIRTVMITGDHAETAVALARQAGIFADGDGVLSGEQVEGMDPETLAAAVAGTAVFARVAPEHKLRVVEAFKLAGIAVAMTGDGVNDAPSLAAADLGIAMGRAGTEVAKQAAGLVLLDDNLKSVVAAVEEGRAIYAGIQRVVTYLLAGSLSLLVGIAAIVAVTGEPPLAPSQVIWLNFATDVLLVLALTAEPPGRHLMDASYRHPGTIITGPMLARMLVMGLPGALAALAAAVLFRGLPAAEASSIVLSTLVAVQWFNAWNARSLRASLFGPGFLFGNRYLVGVTLLSALLQAAALYAPAFHLALHTAAIAWWQWAAAIALAGIVVVAEEMRKAWVLGKS